MEKTGDNCIKNNIFILLIFLVSIVWWLLIFHNFDTPANMINWDTSFANGELQRKSIVTYMQFPLWNPYSNGGEPWLAHPQSDFLSPFFLFILLLGTCLGVTVMYLAYVIIGLLGMYYLSQNYGLKRALCLLNSIFFLNVFNIITFNGSREFLNTAFLPWLLMFLNKMKQDPKKRYDILISVVLALIIYGGAPYIFAMAFIIIGYYMFTYSIQDRSIKPGFKLLKIIFFTFLLGSIKLVPMIELLHSLPRPIKLATVNNFISFQNIQNSFVELKYFFFSIKDIYALKRPLFNEEMMGYSFPFVAVLLLLLSFPLLWKKYKSLVILNIIFIFLALGDNSPINLWRILRLTPLFDWLRRPLKFFCVVIPLWSVCLGLTTRFLLDKIHYFKNKGYIITTLIFCSICFGVFICAKEIPLKWERKQDWYSLEERKANFNQALRKDRKMFEAVYNNKGFVFRENCTASGEVMPATNTPTSDDSIAEQICTKVITRGDNNYKGEYYLLNNHGKVNQINFSPNVLKFNVQADKEDVLVINQNYFPGWRSTSGKIINQNGLIGVTVTKKDKGITVYYFPSSYIMGLIISLISLPLLFSVQIKRIVRI